MQSFSHLPIPMLLSVAQACSDLARSYSYGFGLFSALGFLTVRSTVGGLIFIQSLHLFLSQIVTSLLTCHVVVSK